MTGPARTRVACCQLAPRVGDAAGNLARAEAAIGAARARGAEVIVLPELVTSGYCFADADEAARDAIAADHPLFARWAALAGPAVLVFGYAEAGADGRLYNSAAVLVPGRPPVHYRKTHLWDREKLFFTPGAEPPPVVPTPVGAIGLLVCYDLEFPELSRSLALRGARLLTVPVNWPAVPRPAGLPGPEVVIAMAAARVNRVAIACCDRSGDDGRGARWNEDTTIVAADGWPVATPDADGLAVADLDLAASGDKQISPRNDVLADRRPELYG
jgi:predicted amidohydrolase